MLLILDSLSTFLNTNSINSFIFASPLMLGYYYLLNEFAARSQFPVTDITSSQADRFISR